MSEQRKESDDWFAPREPFFFFPVAEGDLTPGDTNDNSSFLPLVTTTLRDIKRTLLDPAATT